MKMELDVLSNEQGELLKKMTLEFGTVIQADPVTPVIEPLTVTENGEYSVPDGVDGFNPVKVNTPSPVLKPLKITQAGNYAIPVAPHFDGWHPVTVDVPTGWQPQPDWWDIKKIFEEDQDPNKRAIILLSDSLPSFEVNEYYTGNTQAYYKTSDGVSGLTNTIHTFDPTKDKPCSKGYKTRWIMIYSPDPIISVNLAASFITTMNNSLYIYIGNNTNVQYTLGGSGSTIPRNVLLEAVDADDTVTSVNLMSNAIYGCSSLQFFKINNGCKSILQSVFSGCTSLIDVIIPDSVTSIGQTVFQSCNALKSIKIPKNAVLNPMALSNMVSLLYIDIENGYIPYSFNISQSTLFPESSAIDLFTKLGATQSPVTLTFGATLLNRWSQSTKDIAINKGYTLA